MKQIVIGLDFGTSGTKVVVRDLWTNRAEAIRLSAKSSGGGLVLPSSICVEDGRLYFADAAEGRRGPAQLFRGFKMCMACELGLNACQTSLCPNNAMSEGRFRLSADSETFTVSARQLVLWYLAYVQSQVGEYLRTRYGPSTPLRVWTNVGAPIDQESVTGAKAEFVRTAFLSQCLADVIRNGIPLQELRAAQVEAEAKHAITPDEAERTIFVQPETATGLMAFLKSTDPAPGLYAIVDVGAGTTDVSFFRLSIPGHFGISARPTRTLRVESETMAFYEAKTQMLGSGQIDGAVAKLLAPQSHILGHEVLDRARIVKETFDEWSAKTAQVSLTKTEFVSAAIPIVDAIFDVYRRTNFAAFKKEAIQSRWSQFSVFLLGGGTRLSLIRDRFGNCKPSEVIRSIKLQQLVAPRDLKVPEDCDFGILAVAYGLSFAPVEFPTIFRPPEVEPLRLKAAVANIPDRDEQYPK